MRGLQFSKEGSASRHLGHVYERLCEREECIQVEEMREKGSQALQTTN